jgi:hypothetical protein
LRRRGGCELELTPASSSCPLLLLLLLRRLPPQGNASRGSHLRQPPARALPVRVPSAVRGHHQPRWTRRRRRRRRWGRVLLESPATLLGGEERAGSLKLFFRGLGERAELFVRSRQWGAGQQTHKHRRGGLIAIRWWRCPGEGSEECLCAPRGGWRSCVQHTRHRVVLCRFIVINLFCSCSHAVFLRRSPAISVGRRRSRSRGRAAADGRVQVPRVVLHPLSTSFSTQHRKQRRMCEDDDYT